VQLQDVYLIVSEIGDPAVTYVIPNT